jgi:hypothetical protein
MMADEKQTPEEALQTIAEALLGLRTDMAVLRGWTTAQEDTSDEHGKKLIAIRNRIDAMAEIMGNHAARVSELESHTSKLVHAVGKIEQLLGGVVELTKSTFDIVTELKQKAGGADAGRENVASAG